MKIARVKTERWHKWEEGDCGSAIPNYYKKGFWKRYDRKRFIRKSFHHNSKGLNDIISTFALYGQ